MGQLKLVLLAGETRWRARKLNCDKNFENDLDWHEKKGLYIQLHELFNVAKFLSINSVESKCTGWIPKLSLLFLEQSHESSLLV